MANPGFSNKPVVPEVDVGTTHIEASVPKAATFTPEQ